MKDQLQLLERLQEIDNRIDGYETELAKFPLEIQEIARHLVVMRREMSEIREKQAALEKDLRKKEQDVSLEQEKIKRSERRLLNIKNQKEYNALAKEIKLGKKVVAEIEEATLSIMTESENFKKSIERKEKEYAELEKGLIEKKTQADLLGVDADAALSILKQDKQQILEGIDPDLFKRYQTVKKARGQAVAEMQNGSCTACHMAVPPQLNIRVLKQEEMITCPNCHRILYVKPENVPEYNKLES